MWLLIFTNITSHNITNIDQTFMSISLYSSNFQFHPVSFGYSFFEFGADGTVIWSEVSESLEISFVLIEFWAKEKVAAVGKVIQILREGEFGLILVFEFIFELGVLIVTFVDVVVELLLKLTSSLT